MCVHVFMEPEVNVGNLPQCVVFVYDAYVWVLGSRHPCMCAQKPKAVIGCSPLSLSTLFPWESWHGKLLLSRLATQWASLIWAHTHTQLRLAARDLTQVLTAARQIFWAHWAISPVQLPYFFEAGCPFSLNLELTPPSRLVSKPQRCYRLCPSSSVLDCRRVCCCTKVLCGSWGSKSSCHACAVTLHQLSHLSSLIDSDQSQKKYLVKTTQNFGTDSKPNFRIL